MSEGARKAAVMSAISDPGEQEFLNWYAGVSKQLGIAPDPYEKEHYYDYRKFYDAMKRGEFRSPTEPGGHWPSKFKSKDHPRMYLKDSTGRYFNTETNRYVDGARENVTSEGTDQLPDLSPEELQAARQADESRPNPVVSPHSNNPPRNKPPMSDTLSSFGRGAAQGATAGFSDEAIARFLAALPGPQDPEGTSREYAAGSAEQDYLNTERGANAAAASEHPIAYGAGSVAGALPSALAIPGGLGGSGAARVAASGLTGGALGALGGAGHADGQDMKQAIGKGALMGGALGLGGAAAIESMPAMKQAAMSVLDEGMQPIGAQVGPAGAPSAIGAQVGPAGAPSAIGAQINRAGMLPPRPNTGDLGGELGMSVPKAPKPLMPEEAIEAAENLADAAIIANSAKAELGGGATPSQIDRLAWAQNKFDRMGGNGPVKAGKPKAQNTEANSKATVPPKRGRKAASATAQAGQTMPAPVKSLPPAAVRPPQQTVPAPAPSGTPSMRPTMPAPDARTPSMRPTMLDMAPVRPTLKPGTEQAYKDAVMRELADGLRPAGR